MALSKWMILPPLCDINTPMSKVINPKDPEYTVRLYHGTMWYHEVPHTTGIRSLEDGTREHELHVSNRRDRGIDSRCCFEFVCLGRCRWRRAGISDDAIPHDDCVSVCRIISSEATIPDASGRMSACVQRVRRRPRDSARNHIIHVACDASQQRHPPKRMTESLS